MDHSSAIIAARAIQDEIKSARERTGFVDVIPGTDVLARIIDKHLNQDTKSKTNNTMSKTIEDPETEAVAIYRLIRQFWRIKEMMMDEMQRQYPKGSRVVFWRSANQKRESFGTVVGHTTTHGPELRVRYDGSNHVVGLHIGHTKFHSLPKDSSENEGD